MQPERKRRENVGVNKDTIRILNQALGSINHEDKRLALMGDLFMRGQGFNRRRANTFLSQFWREVLSFDINGAADLTVDLCEPIGPMYHNYFHALINGGTAEHVNNQKMFFDNCHEIVKSGGVLLHVAPEKGSFPGHADHYYTETFFVAYANTYNYQILSMDRIEHRQGWAIYAAFRKS